MYSNFSFKLFFINLKSTLQTIILVVRRSIYVSLFSIPLNNTAIISLIKNNS